MDSPAVFTPTRSKYLVFTSEFFIPVVVSLVVIATGVFALKSPYFQVSTVACVLDYQECQDESLLSELGKLKGQNIFTLSAKQVTDRLTSGDFTIREAKLTRTLPSSVKLELQSVYPVVALRVKGDPTWIVLDEKLRVIATRTNDPNVPTVIVPGPLTLKIGKPLEDQTLSSSLKLALRLSDELFSVKTMTLVDANTLELGLEGNIVAIFSPKKDELTQLRTLQAVLADATIIEGMHIIDLRFAQPVLRP